MKKKFLGTFKLHRRGFGFVIPLDVEEKEDVFIPRNKTNNASNNDVVEVEVFLNLSKKSKGPEGKILRIVKKSSNVGIVIEKNKNVYELYMNNSSDDKNVKVRSLKKLSIGDRVEVEFNSKNHKKAKIVCNFGSVNKASTDNDVAMRMFSIDNEFPEDVFLELQSFPKNVVYSKANSDRKDFRHLLTFTIDPTSSKDFDDAISLERDCLGNFLLGVHIADVSHYVKPGTAIDREARKRCNSTYFPDMCIPMLPPKLCDDLCSLKPGVNRLTISVMMKFSHKGELFHYEIVRSIIRSKRRFTYEEVSQILNGKKKSSKFSSTIEDGRILCNLLKNQRRQRGSVELSLSEFVVKLDDDGNAVDICEEKYDISHQIVEEFMIKANEVVANHAKNTLRHFPYRIHEASGDISNFVSLARFFSFTIGDNPSVDDICSIFKSCSDNDIYYQQLAVAFIKSMKLAIYSSENIGHHGLALESYTHFTSPIRRYIDLVVHRIIMDCSVYDGCNINCICSDCSEKERNSALGEEFVKFTKKLRFLHSQFLENPNKAYECVITKVKPFGIIFNVVKFGGVSSMIKICDISDDFYDFDNEQEMFVGRRSGKKFFIGKVVSVVVKSVDLMTSNIRWEISL